VRRNGPTRRGAGCRLQPRHHPVQLPRPIAEGGAPRGRGRGSGRAPGPPVLHPQVSGRDAGPDGPGRPEDGPLGDQAAPGGFPACPQRAAEGPVGPKAPSAAPASSRPRVGGRTPAPRFEPPGEVEAEVAAEGGRTPAQESRNGGGPEFRATSITSTAAGSNPGHRLPNPGGEGGSEAASRRSSVSSPERRGGGGRRQRQPGSKQQQQRQQQRRPGGKAHPVPSRYRALPAGGIPGT
jgi:hypothetical protein